MYEDVAYHLVLGNCEETLVAITIFIPDANIWQQETKIMNDVCMYCKGKLQKGLHEFIARVDDQVVIIKDLPAMICTQCGEAYYSEDAMVKLEHIRKSIRSGKFIAHPVAAGEITATEI